MRKNAFISLLTLSLMIVCGVSFVTSAQSAVIYVDHNAVGNNAGTSWENAHTDLQYAIEQATSGDTIQVRAGTYKPSYQTESGDPRTATFVLKNGVKIYGGNNGETILSGDIGVEGDDSDNSYHVLRGDTFAESDTVLSRFTITKGNANNSNKFPHHDGAGMFNYSSSPTITDCFFTNNSAIKNGGGMYNEGSNVTITNCTFANNTAEQGGGGIFNLQNSPVLTNCTFSGNISKGNGGGIYNYDVELRVINCTIADNIADDDKNDIGDGGGIFITENSTADFINTLVADNYKGTAFDDLYKNEGSNINSDNNLVEFATGHTFSITGDQPELNLGPLADNGGYTQTRALLPDSVAIDKGTLNGAPTKDQRGFDRIAPYDIGAYEFQGKPTVKTSSISSITQTTAKGGGEVTSDGGYDITARGVCWSTKKLSTANDPALYSHTTDGTGKGFFTSSISGLSSGTTYYVRAYAVNKDGYSYGAEVSFSTQSIPTVTTNPIVANNPYEATTGGIILSDGGDTIVAKGVCWSTDTIDIEKEPSNYSYTNDGTGKRAFVSYMSDLIPNTTYYVRAYATNGIGTGYGNEIPYTTLPALPLIETLIASKLTATTAKSGGNITSNGGLAIGARGICWSTSKSPTTSNICTTETTGIGYYTSSLSGLTRGTTYYVRAYASNSMGTAYGKDVSFKTLDVPTVDTTNITEISTMTATCGGNILSTGGMPIITKGICWDIEPIDMERAPTEYPHTTDKAEEGKKDEGIYISLIEGLSVKTTYYVRAYATNSVGIAYGEEKQFTTKPASYPIVNTSDIGAVSSTTASVSGEVLYDGGVPLTEKGVTWRETDIPMIEKGDFKRIEGDTIGTFTAVITGLIPETSYYIRTYATNQEGKTAYGDEVMITTPKVLAVTTTPISTITSKTAISGGNITSDGGLPITARGVCWSLNSISGTAIPTDLDHTSDNTGKGSFTSSVSGLSPDTTYYLRAYAVNSEKFAYGEEIIFATATKATIITMPVSSISATNATAKGNVIDDGGVTVTERGICWSATLTVPELDNEEAICIPQGGDVGVFEVLISGLATENTYYVRAYATNEVTTSYGETLSFQTLTIPGDVNGDGAVNLDDAILALKILAELDTGDTKIYVSADVNGDEQIGIEEVLYILRKVVNAVTITGKISGAGLDVSNARIKIGSDMINTTVTDSEGNFTIQTDASLLLDNAGDAVFPVEVTADGYATGYAKISASTVVGSSLSLEPTSVEIQLVPISDVIEADDNLADGVDINKDGEKVGELTIPDAALPVGVTQATGTVTYIDPTTPEVDGFPGNDFLAVTENGSSDDPVMLESLGLMEFRLKDQNGKPITELNGNAAVCMKVPENLSASPGEKIPMWWYNPENGLWQEEGYGIVEKREDGLWMCGSVNHFTWWNCDRPVKSHSCLKFSFVKESDGTPLNNIEWMAEGITYSGQSPERPCNCSGKDPSPCPDEEKISSFTVKKTENPADPEQIRVFTIISGVRYYLKNDWDKTFSLVTNSEKATVFDTPDVSGSCIWNNNVDQCEYLDKEDGILPLDTEGINFAPAIQSLTAAHQAYLGNNITVYPGETLQINAEISDMEGDDISVSWSSKCGEISNPSHSEDETIATEPDVLFTSSVDFTATQKTGYCSIIFKAQDSSGNIAESSASINIVKNPQKELPMVLSTKSLESGISVTFNKAIDPLTVTAETFILENGISGTLTYKYRIATFTPTNPFEYKKTYSAKVTTGIKDGYGNALPADYVWYFTIGSEITEPIEVELGKISAMVYGRSPNVVYAIDQDKQALYFIDTNAQHIFRKVDLPYPNPLAMDYSEPDNKLYIVSEKSDIIIVYDITTSTITEIPFASPSKIPFDEEKTSEFDIEVAPTLRRIYVFCIPDFTYPYLSIVNMNTKEIQLDALRLGIYEANSLTIDEVNQLMFIGYGGVSRYSIRDDMPVYEQGTFSYGTNNFNKILLSSDGSRVIYNPTSDDLKAYDTNDLYNIVSESEKESGFAYARLSPDGSILYSLSYYDNYFYVKDATDFQIIRTLDFPNASDGVLTPNSDGTAVVGFSCDDNFDDCKYPALYFFTNVRK